ncbi:2-dehydropantoate 2-reductase [Vibrio ishigakensis]|uniref:2-dehydropantoate 2-reductase n=1 Tax=Vibrio ishigakensis TaxID=1481914 RepID=A0A0B8QN16_9VIBR|nr:2-dehydropantoate 2-reductase [Vibrio ishigakensis]
MKITVVGLGAIGSLFAYSLQKAGHQVSVWTRDNALSKTLKLDEHESLNFPANNTQLLEQADLVIICTKSWQLQNVLEQPLAFIPLSTPIVISHNGMGAIEKAQTLLDGRPILFATTTHGALKKDPETVLHTGIGQTVIGPYSKQALNLENLARVFDSALPNAVWQTSIKQALWNKLAINCCINPITAILDCRNGELDTPDSLQIIEALCGEITKVMLAEATKPIQRLCSTQQKLSSKRPQLTIHQCIKTFRTKE